MAALCVFRSGPGPVPPPAPRLPPSVAPSTRTPTRGDWRKKRRARRKRERPKGIYVSGEDEEEEGTRASEPRMRVATERERKYERSRVKHTTRRLSRLSPPARGRRKNGEWRTRLGGKGRDTGRDETANEYKREEEARCEKGQRPGKRERERETHGRGGRGYAAERDARRSLASKDQQVTLGILRVERGKERESLAFENVCQGRCPHIIAQSIII